MTFWDEISSRLSALSGAPAPEVRQGLNEFTVRDIEAVRIAGGGGGSATLAQVLTNGNLVAGHEIVAATNPGANAGAFLALLDGDPGVVGGDATLQAGDGATGESGGDLYLLAGAGDGAPSAFGRIRLHGNQVGGGDITIEPGDATGGNSPGGSIILTPGSGFGAGADGGVILDTNMLPTTDPANPGQLWQDPITFVLKVSQG